MQLSLDKFEKLKGKNLLAFSGGIDSTALFFILLESKIDFDIAIVDYNIRKESKEEIAYAKKLANKYQKKIYTKSVYLSSSNFEAKAREVRYRFFEEIIKEYSYTTLLTAHQLDDRFEWFCMQLSKGAGVVELMGLQMVVDRGFYTIYRPLLNYTKDELLSYLHDNNIKYFIDESNKDIKYKRNYFRQNYTSEFLQEFKEGVKRSFQYLDKDYDELLNIEILFHKKDFYILKKQDSDIENIRIIDKIVKKFGIVLSQKTKEEVLKQKESVISHKIVVAIDEKYIYIAPYVKNILSKEEKELFRKHKIPSKIRFYLSMEKIFSF